MARHWFGQAPADWIFSVGTGNTAVLDAGVDIDIWSAKTGGSQYTDLLDASGAPVTSLVSGDGSFLPAGTIPEFQGPDGVTEVWVDASAGVRFKLVATDLGADIAGKLDRSGGAMDGTLTLVDDSPAASQAYVDARAGGAPLLLPFGYAGIISVRTGVERIYNDTGRPLTIGTVRVSAGTGPVGQALIVDVHKNGTTIFSTQANRPKIADGQVTGTAPAPDTPVWGIGEYLTVDVDQVGTTTPGSNLTVTIPAT